MRPYVISRETLLKQVKPHTLLQLKVEESGHCPGNQTKDHFISDFKRGNAGTVNGENFCRNSQGLEECMQRTFGEPLAEELYLAYSQPHVIRFITDLLQINLLGMDPQGTCILKANSSYNLHKEGENTYLDVLTQNLCLSGPPDPDDPLDRAQVTSIPGSVLTRFKYDPEKKKFQIEKLACSSEFLKKTIFNEIDRYKEDLPSEPKVKLLNNFEEIIESEVNLLKKIFKSNLTSVVGEWKPEFDGKLDKYLITIKRAHETFLLSSGDYSYTQERFQKKLDESFKELLEAIPTDPMKSLTFSNPEGGFQKCLNQLHIKASTKIFVDVAINRLASHCEQFPKNTPKGKEAGVLLEDLINTSCGFYKGQCITPESFEEFKIDFSRKIHMQESALNIDRKIWHPLISNVALAATGVGILVIVGRAIYGAATNKSLFFNFFNTASYRLAKQTERTVNALELPKAGKTTAPSTTPTF